jgi:GAF domain-containing protein
MKSRGRKAKASARKTARRRPAGRERARAARNTGTVASLKRALAEALEQQAATADVLKVISNSPGDLEPVFGAVLDNATRICGAQFGTLFLFDGEKFRLAAQYKTPAALQEFQRQRGPFVPETGTSLHQTLRTKIVHTADDATRSVQGFASKLGGARSTIHVPMLKDNTLVGVFVIYRQEVKPFTDKQIELVQSFAAQAVIAVENARLLNELRQRTDDLSEALEQQTATSEVLQVISSSPGDLEPVFQTMLERAVRICGAKFGTLYRCEGDAFRLTASYNAPIEFREARRRNPLTRRSNTANTGLDRAAITKKPVQIADVQEEPAYRAKPEALEFATRTGARSLLAVPLLKEGELVGVVVIYRQEVRPFSDKQTELVQNFAAQAVIAIENARLLSELRQRTDDLSESLEQQTATADVLKVISRSAYDLHTVLDSLLRTAGRLCDADRGTITQKKGDQFYRAVSFGFPVEYIEYIKDRPVEPGRNTGTGRALVEGKIVHIPDVHNDPEFNWPEAQKLGGFRTMLGVPMLREGIPMGVMALTRSEVRPFTDKQIELVGTFADQAAIAIENVRLFDEIQDKSRQLEEASEHKSRFLANMSHELRTPLNAILGYTELIQDSVYGAPPEKMVSVLERIQRNGKHLLGLINDVLDLSKIEAGQLVLNLDSYSIRDVVHDVYSAVEPLAASTKAGLQGRNA